MPFLFTFQIRCCTSDAVADPFWVFEGAIRASAGLKTRCSDLERTGGCDREPKKAPAWAEAAAKRRLAPGTPDAPNDDAKSGTRT